MDHNSNFALMFDLTPTTNSIVILAVSHNPTLVSESFFKDSKIIVNFDDVDRSSMFITPLASQVRLKDGTSLMLDNSKLNIISNIESKDAPFLMAKNYCSALPYIKCRAVGINFEYVSNLEINLGKLIASLEFDQVKTKSIDFTFPSRMGYKCNVKVDSKKIAFNHHRDYSSVPLSQIDSDFLNHRNSCESLNLEFIQVIKNKIEA